MKNALSYIGDIVASHSVAVTVAALITATLVFLVLSGFAGRVAVLIEERHRA
jgi:hypothetical protein